MEIVLASFWSLLGGADLHSGGGVLLDSQPIGATNQNQAQEDIWLVCQLQPFVGQQWCLYYLLVRPRKHTVE